MRLALAGLLFAASAFGDTIEFVISVSQPLRVLTPFTVQITAAGNHPRPPSDGTFTLDGQPYTPGRSLGGGYSFICQDAGTHEIGFHFAGNETYDPSDAYVTFEVLPKIATFVSTPATDPPIPAAGQPFTISTVASTEEGAPTGFVGFYNGATLVATGAAGPNQTFSATIVLGLGTHSLTARYNTTGIYAESTSPPLVLSVARSATVLGQPTISGLPRFGQPVTIHASISPAATGPVTFFDGAAELGTALLTNGTASITTSSLAIGPHDITARYAGTADFAASTSPVLKQAIKGLPTLTLASDRNPAPNLTAVSFTATLASPSPLAPAPTGAITLRDGDTLLGNAPLNINLPAGEHPIIASYAGDANYEPVTATMLQRITGSAPTNLSIETVIGDTASLDLRISSATAPPPGGTVRVTSENGSVTIPVMGGRALLSDARQFLGRRIVAEYAGDDVHTSATASDFLVLAPVNAFSYGIAPLAPSQIVTVFGAAIVSATVAEQPASVYFSSPTQATIALPDSLPDGLSRLSIDNGQGRSFTALVNVERTAPGIATASADGAGPPAAQLLRLRAGSQRTELLDGPIVFNGDEIYLILYGTGFRHAAKAVTCHVQGGNGLGLLIPAAYAGPQGEFTGLDQINLPLSASLTHAGSATLTCTADGRTSNAVSLVFP